MASRVIRGRFGKSHCDCRRFTPDLKSVMRRRFTLLAIFCFISVFLTTMPAGAATRAEITNAIKRGAAYLQTMQQEDGSIPEGGHRLGGTALATLALLESNVSAKEPSIKKAVSHVREQCVRSQSTYEVALCIMLLDKLGDKSDKRLIRGLGQRLRDGQAQNGAWTYRVPLEATASPTTTM